MLVQMFSARLEAVATAVFLDITISCDAQKADLLTLFLGVHYKADWGPASNHEFGLALLESQSSRAAAMEVCFLASGEKAAVFDPADFEGKTAKAVKHALAAKTDVTTFRQRLFLEGDAVEIPDDEVFASVPVKVQLVVLEFCPPDAEEDEKMMVAARENDTNGLEQLLNRPRNPKSRRRSDTIAPRRRAWTP